MFSKECKQHLKEVDETAVQHMCVALKAAVRLQLCVPVLIVHAIAPRFFTHTASKTMQDILDRR
jgi:hypothetical protein